MSNHDTFEWESSILGQHSAYPGHPIVLGCMIIERYQNLEHAMRVEDGEQFPNASADGFIPGAGDAVSTALAVLRVAKADGLPAAYALAEQYWDGYGRQSEKNAQNVALGREQCEKLKPRFEEHLGSWGTPNAIASQYRLDDQPAARDTTPRRRPGP